MLAIADKLPSSFTQGPSVSEAVFNLPLNIRSNQTKALEIRPLSTSLIGHFPVDPAEYAPNGFGDDSLGLIRFIHELSPHTRRLLDDAFRVDTFNITSGLPEEAFRLADLLTTFPNSTENGTSGKHDPTGTSYAWIAADQTDTAAQMGISPGDAIEVVAAQEVTHSIVRAHPQLAGKFTTAESEVMGELASLAINQNYDIMTLRNALMGYPGPNGNVFNPEYALISERFIAAAEALFSRFNISMPGGDFLNDYVIWNAQQSGGNFSTNQVTRDNLASYVEERLGIDANVFMERFPIEVFNSFRDGAHQLLRDKLAMPDR